MRVLFERTGGFAGIKLSASFDSESLPPRQARRLEKLLEDCRFFRLPVRLEEAAPSPDRFLYKLTVESRNCVHTVHAGEGAVPAEMRPLLEWLTAAARRR
ncbi:MAG: hypothetical protein H6Q05_512 [Acidobacteria bacterium]|jgi:hypothetical protein|nr:hypothetical protein [Acidobacteriota bacterium]